MKAFIAYELPNGIRLNDNAITHEHAIKEPTGNTWYQVGLVPHPTLYHDEIEQGLYTSRERDGEQSLVVAIVERVLPSNTIKRHLNAMRVAFEQEHGQAVVKNQMAQWKEQFINDTLPNCPLKESRIEVSFDYKNNKLLVGTSSQKTADTIIAWLNCHLFKDNPLSCSLYRPPLMTAWLNHQLEMGTYPYESCKMQNHITGKKLSFTNDVDCMTARNVFAESERLSVVELGCVIPDVCLFSVNDKSVIKGIKYLLTDEQKNDIDESRAEGVVVADNAKHILQVDTNRKILAVLKEVEDYVEDDL